MNQNFSIFNDSVSLLDTLIAFDTTSRVSNLGLIEWVRDQLAALGIKSRLSFDASGGKANLFATIGEGSGGIVLSGHSDVVPTDGQAWSSDPFIARHADGRIYGRGTADMKGFIACALAAVPRALEQTLHRPLHIALTYDEEVGCIGVRTLLEDLAQAGIRPESCVVGEPTGMRPIIAHKGRQSFRCRVRGREAHSSLAPQAVNAIEYAARLIVRLQDFAREEAQNGFRAEGFDIPFSTLATGTIKGGIASNVIPRDCEFTFEYRYLPGIDPDALVNNLKHYAATLEQEMRQIDTSCQIAFEQETHAASFDATQHADFVNFARTLCGQQSASKVAYATEAGFFQRAGIATVVCGPGWITEAHRPDEFVEISQLRRCDQFLADLVASLQHLTPKK